MDSPQVHNGDKKIVQLTKSIDKIIHVKDQLDQTSTTTLFNNNFKKKSSIFWDKCILKNDYLINLFFLDQRETWSRHNYTSSVQSTWLVIHVISLERPCHSNMYLVVDTRNQNHLTVCTPLSRFICLASLPPAPTDPLLSSHHYKYPSSVL